jgi:hypothetical protein
MSPMLHCTHKHDVAAISIKSISPLGKDEAHCWIARYLPAYVPVDFTARGLKRNCGSTKYGLVRSDLRVLADLAPPEVTDPPQATVGVELSHYAATCLLYLPS